MPYEYTAAQLRFLRNKYAKEKDEEKCCDCPGCEKCSGFVRNCTCDHDLSWLPSRNGTQKEGVEPRQAGRIESRRDGMEQEEAPEHVDKTAFEEYGF